MYVEQTTTGINIMDLTEKEVSIIRDSIKKVALSLDLFQLSERQVFEQLIRKISNEIQR